jgi:DNA-directed RNA polymerase subunit RPC12/RpoP
MSMQMYPCPHCAAEFDTFATLEHHLEAAHRPNLTSAKFRCSTCDAEFMAQAKWLDHACEPQEDVA